mmetsp:Transcript_19534/g.34844  ORF Transcript_19534/g.34844 Transcript_19534/m.34844 type:complete len:417 (-) Transcript_19534:257-1507(-)
MGARAAVPLLSSSSSSSSPSSSFPKPPTARFAALMGGVVSGHRLRHLPPLSSFRHRLLSARAAVVATAAPSGDRPAAKTMPVVKSTAPLGFPYKTLDPFLFCVYHKDDFPVGNEKMEAPRRGNGADFDWSQPYRMYHGDRVPGFPQHPHRGFETLTATTEGYVDHTDSMGNAGRYGVGDLQWMTAGKGIVHGEMFPLVNSKAPNPMKLFQIWLNLPGKSKMTEPAFVMHWGENIPRVHLDEGRVKVTVWAGELMGKKGLKPPPESWAAQAGSDVAVWLLEMAPGGKMTLPPAAGGGAVNRALYHYEGEGLEVGGVAVKAGHMVELRAGDEAGVCNTHESKPTGILMLQGKPIGEPVAKHGPFVMNTRAEIQQAFDDYSATRFGGWPWDDNAPIFPRDKGRFALVNGKEERPPAAST